MSFHLTFMVFEAEGSVSASCYVYSSFVVRTDGTLSRFALQGGFVRKLQEWKQPGKAFLLSVEDAQQPGKDIGSGTFNIRMVQQLLAACLSTLHQCQAKQAQHADPAQREADAWAAVQVSALKCCSASGQSMHSMTCQCNAML